MTPWQSLLSLNPLESSQMIGRPEASGSVSTHRSPGEIDITVKDGGADWAEHNRSIQADVDFSAGINWVQGQNTSALSRLFNEVQHVDESGEASRAIATAVGGACLRVGKNVSLKIPISFFHRLNPMGGTKSSGFISVIWLEEGACAEVHEDLGDGSGNAESSWATFVHLSSGAKLALHRVVRARGELRYGARLFAHQERDSTMTLTHLTGEGTKLEHLVWASQAGEGASTTMRGLSVGRDRNDTQVITRIFHRRPRGQSDQVHRSIAKDRGRIKFSGRISISEGAMKVDSKQKSHSLLLGPGAEIVAVPELDVLADDVKAGHGATVGRLNPDEIFYLQSRGIPRERAEKMLTMAFAESVLCLIESGQIQRRMQAAVRELIV